MKTLYLAWQEQVRTRRWYPIGRLEAEQLEATPPEQERISYRFCYIRGVDKAGKETGFKPLESFPDISRVYQSRALFPLFRNRLPSPQREDYKQWMGYAAMSEGARDPMILLALTGGIRATDTFEVFPRIEHGPDGGFSCRFFLHGFRHVNTMAQDQLNSLQIGAPLQLVVELNNPATGIAIQIQTETYHMLGWAPRYLVNDLVCVMAQAPLDLRAKIVKINPASAPSEQRVVVELNGKWPDHYSPMSGDDYQPMVS